MNEHRTIERDPILDDGTVRRETIEREHAPGAPGDGDEQAGGAVVGGVAGAAVGAVVGGPVGAVVGGAVGAAAGATAGLADESMRKDDDVTVDHDVLPDEDVVVKHEERRW